MGYAIVTGFCFGCGGIVNFNPLTVPSTRDNNGVKQPVCRTCVERLNRQLRAAGKEPIKIAADAYEPVNEEALP